MERSLRDWIDEIALLIGLGMMVLGLVGEFLGGWGAIGFLLNIFGAAVGLLALWDLNGRKLVAGQQEGNEHLSDLVDGQGGLLANQGTMIGNQQVMIGNQDRMLGELAAMNEGQVHTHARLDDISRAVGAEPRRG